MASSKFQGVGVLFIVLFLGVLAGSGTGLYFALMHDLPEIQGLEALRAPAITRIYSSDGVVLAEWFSQRRDPVPLSTIPEYLKKAIIATEDQAFYSHSGVVLKGLMRAVVHNVRAGRFKEGASTITQQLAKTLFLSPEKTLTRKLKEAVLATQLERRYTKDEILERYLNHIYFGSGAYGVSFAARKFFGKRLDELTLDECALIAGAPKSPSNYSPLINPERAIWRRNVVLNQMGALGFISQEDLKKAVETPIVTAPPAKGGQSGIKAPYFVETVRRVLEDALGDHVLYKEGIEVHTSLNYELQKQAELAVISGVEKIIKREGLESGGINGALVCIDATSGEILTLVGGTDYGRSAFDRATMAHRQPGSAFKPFVFACAIEQGMNQSTIVADEPVVFPGPTRKTDWRPENYSGDYLGDMSFRKALAYSRNIPAAKLINVLSPSRVVELAKDLGIRSYLNPYLSLALGSSEVTLLELTGAYAAFPNNGEWIEPHGIIEVVDRNGRVIHQPRPQKRVALTEQCAAVIVNMLEAVVQEGSGKRARTLSGPVAGKTGTTTKCKDALFLGFSPNLAAGVWVGRDDGSSMGKNETGSWAALPIWVDFMKHALKNRPLEYFPIPDGVITVSVDPAKGHAVDDGKGVQALFIKGTEPGRGKPKVRLSEILLEN